MKSLPALITLIVTMMFVVSPALTDPFSGFRADQLPIPQIDPPIQPAGYAFAIWGLIYGWLVVSAIFGMCKRRDDAAWNSARRPLIVSLLVGTPWLAIANASAIWATVTIIIMALFAIAALIRAPQADRWWFQAPVAIYAGWLTAASFVSLSSTAAGFGILTDALGWAFVGLACALIVALSVNFRRPNAPEYALAVVWALVGIIVANLTAQIWVTAAAALGIIILVSATLKNNRKSES